EIRHLPSVNGGRLLDVGCGSGDYLVRMRALGWDVAGLEPDHAAASQARRRDLAVEVGTAETADFPAESFDAITLSHVIEHLHDPHVALERCARWLKPHGVLWLATPDLDSAGQRRYGRDWLALDPPRH